MGHGTRVRRRGGKSSAGHPLGLQILDNEMHRACRGERSAPRRRCTLAPRLSRMNEVAEVPAQERLLKSPIRDDPKLRGHADDCWQMPARRVRSRVPNLSLLRQVLVDSDYLRGFD